MERPALAAALGLDPHPEGGWYRQTWVAPETVVLSGGRARPTGTCILFALAAGESSAWHRLTSEEVWLAHTGTVDLVLGGTGPTPEEGDALTLGTDLAAGQHPQLLVRAGVWQPTRPVSADALVSCVVSPGFDFEDFEQL
jgi:predicted cupin superfamily sugar epimerase